MRSVLLPLSIITLASCLPRKEKKQPVESPAATHDAKPRPKSTSKKQAAARPSSSPTSKPQPAATVVKKNVSASNRQPPAVSPKSEAGPDPVLRRAFVDKFERSELGANWRATSKAWTLDQGQLCVSKAYNHPLWLARRLPANARVEFDATGYSDDGDIKAEFWGDGRSAASKATYDDATSYLTIFGGWKNRFHVLARLDEHAKDRKEIRIDVESQDLSAQPVERARRYHFKVERRDGKTIQWLVDDIEMLKLVDKSPLSGGQHEHFGFNNWSVRVCFDNLEIAPVMP